jgi:uncharacterized membrane protein YciS (DUF1049 family)
MTFPSPLLAADYFALGKTDFRGEKNCKEVIFNFLLVQNNNNFSTILTPSI